MKNLKVLNNKPKLKSTTKMVIELQDWNNLVEETYKRPYNFQHQDGCKDRGFFEFTVPVADYELKDDNMSSDIDALGQGEEGVKFELWLSRDPSLAVPGAEDRGGWFIELWWKRNFYPDIYTLIDDLYKRGLLEAGAYVIDIDW